MSRQNAAIIVFALLCTSIAVVTLALTFSVKDTSGSTALIVDRLERIEEKLETHDNRRNAQYGNLRSLIGDDNETRD